MTPHEKVAATITRLVGAPEVTLLAGDDGRYAHVSVKLPDGRTLVSHAGPCSDALHRAMWEVYMGVLFATGAKAVPVRHDGDVVIGIDHQDTRLRYMVSDRYGEYGIKYRSAA